MSRFFHMTVAFAVLLSILTSGATCQAVAPDTSAASFVLMDADSGRILAGREENTERAIASTTKIMTALVAMERSAPEEIVTVRREHLKEGSSMYLREGEELTMESLLYGLMLPSGNDAAECIASYCGGVPAFVDRMNEKAADLGMTHTHFANPSGLDAEGHYSCALDMAHLAAYAMQDPSFVRIASTKTAKTVARDTMANHNKLLGRVEGCIGLKTGYTTDAGRTLVTCAERDGLRLIAVTLRDGNDWQDHAALYEYGFSAYRRACALEGGAVCALTAVRGGDMPFVRAIAERSDFYPIKEGETLSLRIECVDELHAPVRKGQKLGEAVVLLDGNEVGRVNLTAQRAVSTASSPQAKRTERSSAK